MIDLALAAPRRLRHVGEWPTPTPRRAPLDTELRALQDSMPACDGGAAPVLSGDGNERAMLIGQAPGWREIETGLPFAWDAGKRLSGWLSAADIDIDAFRDRWYVTSIAKCYPGRAQGSSVDRPPSRSEIEAWTP
ncbi:MAG: uracil-DNA glycosylase family protein, partial [Candidatus Limnocylindria bacterium]